MVLKITIEAISFNYWQETNKVYGTKKTLIDSNLIDIGKANTEMIILDT